MDRRARRGVGERRHQIRVGENTRARGRVEQDFLKRGALRKIRAIKAGQPSVEIKEISQQRLAKNLDPSFPNHVVEEQPSEVRRSEGITGVKPGNSLGSLDRLGYRVDLEPLQEEIANLASSVSRVADHLFMAFLSHLLRRVASRPLAAVLIKIHVHGESNPQRPNERCDARPHNRPGTLLSKIADRQNKGDLRMRSTTFAMASSRVSSRANRRLGP